ncbi:MAG: acyltransferase [Colwellia sp.]|nr:acyltransferase [Colwellia sp.]
MKIFRLFRAVKNKFVYAFYTVLNRVSLHTESVKFLPCLTIFGRIFIRNYGGITLGRNVKITSSFSKNPIVNSFFTSLVTEKNGKITIGDNTGISNSFFYSVSSITIGENVLIGAGCKVYDTDFHSIDPSERIKVGDKGRCKPVSIGDNVFIGASTFILKGAQIGNGSVIGANSVVSGAIPDNQIWAGNPAKFISHIKSVEKKS